MVGLGTFQVTRLFPTALQLHCNSVLSCRLGGWNKTNMGESEQENARLKVWGYTNPDAFSSFPPLLSAPSFLTSIELASHPLTREILLQNS